MGGADAYPAVAVEKGNSLRPPMECRKVFDSGAAEKQEFKRQISAQDGWVLARQAWPLACVIDAGSLHQLRDQ